MAVARLPVAVLGGVLSLLVITLDQLSKWLIVAMVMQPPRQIVVLPVFDLVLAWNRGISFSMLHSDEDAAPFVLSAVAVAIVLCLCVWLARTRRPVLALAIGLVIGGALGNVIDRLRFGAVIDFLYFHLGSYYWPAFNLADSAITVGVLAMLIDGLSGGSERVKKTPDTGG
jgi:signal peptidase II